MPLQAYFDNLEPDSVTAEIWRFMPFEHFVDLMANDELYFRRADLFVKDENEGIPPDDYVRRTMGLRRTFLEDELELNHQVAMLAQDREAFFVSCWHLYRDETMEMWQNFANDGVAIRSRYDLLRVMLDGMLDTTHLGIMRYGEGRLHQTGRTNVLQLINTKRIGFAGESEVRAILWSPDPFAGGARHIDINNIPHPRPLLENPRHSWVPEYKRRRIDLKALITGIVVSPWAAHDVLDAAQQWAAVKNHSYEVRRSILSIL